MSSGRVLSIQSHVVHGYVGNRAAVFPLQLLDFEVDFINSVQYSNHTEYKHLKGQKLNSTELDALYQGLKLNELIDYTHLLTGFADDITFLNKLADIVVELKLKNPNLVYLCDPVLGDNNQWYVPQAMLPIYKERIIPHADIITPNSFELEILYGQPLNCEEDVLKAMQACHDLGVKTVIVSSIPSFDDKNKLNLFASSKLTGKIIKIEFERLRGCYYGTGDTFAAMFLAWYAKFNDLEKACEHSVSAMLHILNRTLNTSLAKQIDVDVLPFTEIQLVPSKMDIMNPQIIVKAKCIA